MEQDSHLRRDDPNTWTVERYGIADGWLPSMGAPYSDAYSPKLRAAFDQLMGPDKYEESSLALGWWVVTFPGFWDERLADYPGHPPEVAWGAAGHWHIDGAHFQHYINSKEVGLLPIFLFNTIGKHDGGTLLCPGSHRVVAEILHEYNEDDGYNAYNAYMEQDMEPDIDMVEEGGGGGEKNSSGGTTQKREEGEDDWSEEEEEEEEAGRGRRGGLTGGEISAEVLKRCDVANNAVEVQGSPGDVVLCHPFMLHARSMNCGSGLDRSVRPMCHPGIALKKAMSIYRGVGEAPKVSPVERVIVDAVQNLASGRDQGGTEE